MTDRDPALLRRIYETMVLTRAVEDRMVAMYKGGDLLGSLYTGHWHEAISVGAASTLRPGRLHGADPPRPRRAPVPRHGAVAGDGQLHGQGHLADRRPRRHPALRPAGPGHYNLPSHIPANFPVATGMAFAAKYRGEDKVCLAFCGDGSTSRADFHEALTMASALSLPNVFVIENNQFAYSTPLRMQSNSATFADKAVAYGIPGVQVDGTDALAVHDAVAEAVARARAGNGPSIIEGVTMRMHGHAEHDPADYVPHEMYEEWAKKDPVELFEKVLLEAGVHRRGHRGTGPEGRAAGCHRRAQARRSPIRCRIRARSRRAYMPTDSGQATYLEAVGLALDHEMDRDPDTFLIGEDVGQYGGAFKVTKGFLDKYGPRRVVDTPIAETGFTGLAAGAALVGLRPIVEYQFADFISCAFDPIVNVLAKHYYRTGDPMPVTMRAPFGGRLRAGPCHSQSVESYFAHVPGHQDRHAGNAARRCGLLISSIRDNNPTLYLENKYLYRRLKAAGPLSMDPIPLGVANVVRRGHATSP